MAEIRCFAADFAPRNWAYCSGQLLAVNTNQALYSLLGTTYGGNGIQTFALPDLRSRIPVGTGQPTYGGALVVIGQKAGEENHSLITTEMPGHTHVTTTTPGTGTALATATIYGTSAFASAYVPAGQLLGSDDGNGTVTLYATPGSPVAMAPTAVTLSNITPSTPAVTLAPTGGNLPHSNIQPVLGMNYVICTSGIYPSRN